ncbi:MAG: ParB N-terminal domain-containing protein [Christensenellaceae bacterium]|jgi:DNA modification methylase|nr:ParB N-terminal domain-containing protein [Christensenellaceae bacterium]
MQTKKMNLRDLQPAEYNPRKDLRPGDPEFESLKRSIETFGYVEPIIFNVQTGHVVGGHQRLKVLLDLGIEEEEVVIVDLHPNDEKALNIALNKISGDWDMPKLKDILEALDTGAYDVTLTGFSMAEIEDIMTQYTDAEEADDDFDVEDTLDSVGKNPLTQPGDIYIIANKHRLMCGDASKPGAAAYVFHADSEGLNFRYAFQNAGFDLRQCLVWVKNALVLGRQDYQWRHEPILYGWKGGAAHYFTDDRTNTTVIEDEQPNLDKMKKPELLAYIKQYIRATEEHTTILRENKPTKSDEHPTMKPVSLVGRLINNSSKIGWITLDLFGGSGSTLMDCEQLQRTCYTMELDPRFCDVIVLRYLAWCADKGHDAEVELIRGGQRIPCPFSETDE